MISIYYLTWQFNLSFNMLLSNIDFHTVIHITQGFCRKPTMFKKCTDCQQSSYLTLYICFIQSYYLPHPTTWLSMIYVTNYQAYSPSETNYYIMSELLVQIQDKFFQQDVCFTSTWEFLYISQKIAKFSSIAHHITSTPKYILYSH